MEFNFFIDSFVKTTVQVLYDVGLFDRFENKDEIFEDNLSEAWRSWSEHITFNK